MKPTTRDGILRGGRTAAIRLLIIAAAGISAYLLSVSLTGGRAVGCGPGSACDEVLQSRWAYVFGIPVSALALVVDLALLLTSFACGKKSTPKQRRGAWEIMVPCAVLVLGAALWFVALQAFVLHRFCPWCMAAHSSGALAAILLLLRVPVTDAVERRDKDPGISRTTVVKFTAFAVIAIALLGVAQTFAPGKTYSVTVVPAAPTTSERLATNVQVSAAQPTTSSPPVTNLATVKPTLTQSNSPVTQGTNSVLPSVVASAQTLDVFGGRIRLDLAQVPVWGAPDAPHKLISLYDYTCHHCREMHERVVAVQRSFAGKLAVVSLPMPLDSECNSLIRRTHPSQVNACIYARLGLSVWRARRSAIQEFDDWVFSFPQPPPLTEVTNKVLQLIGAVAFEAVSRDPWIEMQIRTDIDLFTVSMRDYKNDRMPQFMIGTNVFSGILTMEQLRAQVAAYVEPIPGK
jgi:uncharacterized membrane protein